MTKAIFFDIDGTLLSFNTHSIPQSAINAINAAKKQGIKVFLATGRLLWQIQKLDGLEFDGFITVNGSYCITTDGNVIFKKTIPREELKSLISFEANKIRFPYSFMLNKGIYVNTVNQDVEALAQLVQLPVPEIRNLNEMVDEEVFQMNIYVNNILEEEIMRGVLVSCESSRWNPIFADINVKGINKRVGIDKFLEYYNIDLSETMAFGDGGNDIEMLKHVAIGVAMGNASDNVKQIADYVTDSVDNDGIEKALEHFDIIK